MKYTILLLLVLISSCSLLPKKKETLSDTFVTGLFGDKKYTKDQISFELTKATTISGGSFSIEAFPITKPYIDATIREMAALRGLTAREQSDFRESLDFMTGKMTCFEIRSQVKIFEEASNLKDWTVRLQTKELAVIEKSLSFTWDEETQRSLPIQGVFYGPQGKSPYWSMTGVACHDGIINLANGFTLFIKSPYVQWPFSAEASLVWEFDRFEKDQSTGEVIKVKEAEKTKSARPYRDW